MIIDYNTEDFPWPSLSLYMRTPERWHEHDWRNDTLYHRFVSWCAEWMTEPYLFQVEPNLRIHPPGGVAVPWHSDGDFGHLEAEWNVWVPLTRTTDDSQRLWVEDMGPIRVAPGQAYLFSGAVTRHGNRTNATADERRSFDFRLCPTKDYEDRGLKTVEYGVPLRVPEYWRSHA